MQNKVFLTGHITKPVKSFSTSGKAKIDFRIAVKRDGNKRHTDWVPCCLWGIVAETHMDYLLKGRRIQLEGRLEVDKGDKVTFFRVNVEKVYYLDKKGDVNERETTEQF